MHLITPTRDGKKLWTKTFLAPGFPKAEKHAVNRKRRVDYINGVMIVTYK